MLRNLLLGKIHRCHVTRADLNYQGSVTIDPLLVEAAGFLPHEKVDLYNITNGNRFSTYVLLGEPGQGEIGVNGAAAHLVKPEDLLIIAAYGWLSSDEIPHHRPKVVFVDEKNRITEVTRYERNPPAKRPPER